MKSTVMVFLAVVLISQNLQAVSVLVASSSYEKGQEIVFDIQCNPLEGHVLSMIESKIIVLRHEFECPQNGAYTYSYKTSFLDPAGDWGVEVLSESERASKEITVNEPREAGFLLIRFLSPTSTVYRRGEKMIISLEVVDASQAVNDANVVFFGLNGEKIFLEKTGLNAYVSEYVIPLDASTGEWKLKALAQRATSNGPIGGAGEIKIEVQKAAVLLEVIEPKVTSFDVGTKVAFNISAKYSNNEPFTQGKMSIIFAGKEMQLSNLGQGNFFGEAEVKQYDLGSIEAIINASDDFGNSSTMPINLVAQCSATCLLQQFGPIVLAIGIAGLAVFGFLFSKINHGRELKKLEAEKNKTQELIKTLQEEYFTKGVMPAASYKKNLGDYKAKITEMEEKIRVMKKKMEKN